MAKLPNSAKKDLMSQSLDGVYGRFKTENSFELDYILASLRINDLSKLVTAAQAFDFKHIHFEELVQRDVDYGRVDDELVKEYLERDADRVIFFPPLLVSLVAVKDGRPLQQYSTVADGFERDDTGRAVQLLRTWDRDKFQLMLNLSDNSTGYVVETNDGQFNFYNYAATIRYNPESIKLVVIDGQHRFLALERLASDAGKRNRIRNVEVPVCVFFTPGALVTKGEGERIPRDLRELFVTVNRTAREVSGHFVDLLNDRSLASHIVRSFANKWKGDASSGSLLPLLEWNTREARKAHQRTKLYSITTVSIVAEAFRKYVFDSSVAGHAEILLKLRERDADFRALKKDFSYSEVSEDYFPLESIPILTEQANRYVTPALHILFTELGPYRALVDQYEAALSALDAGIEKRTPGFEQFKLDVLFQFRRCQQNDQAAVKDAERVFEGFFKVAESQEVYFLNVFQQALIRAWSRIVAEVVLHANVLPAQVARCFLAALEKRAVNESVALFSAASRPYLQEILYRGARVLVNETARQGWVDLILATFASSGVRQAFFDAAEKHSVTPLIDERETIDDRLSDMASTSIKQYLATYEHVTEQDMKKNWKFKDLDSQTQTFLLQREGAEDQSLKQEYLDKIRSLAHERIGNGVAVLANQLSVSREYLISLE